MAATDTGDPDHAACRRLLENHRGPLFVPMLVIAEVAYLLERGAGVPIELRFLKDLSTGTYEAMPVEQVEWIRIAELTSTYRDMTLGTVDSSVVALAERLKVTQIATLDHRHFSVVRPRHVAAFELLP